MNLDSPERLKLLVKEHPFGGGKVWLRKLTIAKWRELVKARQEIVKSESDEKDGFTWGALSLSQQLCDADGKLVYDTDEWRQRLATELSADEMAELLIAAHTWSGVAANQEQKKS